MPGDGMEVADLAPRSAAIASRAPSAPAGDACITIGAKLFTTSKAGDASTACFFWVPYRCGPS